jgi:hypothetical protein
MLASVQLTPPLVEKAMTGASLVPAVPTATHRVAVGHEIDRTCPNCDGKLYADQSVKSEVTATPWPIWPVAVTTEFDPSTATQYVVPGAQDSGDIGGKSPTNKLPGGVTAVHPAEPLVRVVVEVVVVLEVVVLELEVVVLEVVVGPDVVVVVDVGAVVVVPPMPVDCVLAAS